MSASYSKTTCVRQVVRVSCGKGMSKLKGDRILFLGKVNIHLVSSKEKESNWDPDCMFIIFCIWNRTFCRVLIIFFLLGKRTAQSSIKAMALAAPPGILARVMRYFVISDYTVEPACFSDKSTR